MTTDTLDFLQQLELQVMQELDACIGCHDCMQACPLDESSQVTIAELNLAVTQPVIQAANVQQFVLACTQCQACVPVCPAQLSRANMVLWNKLKVERELPDQPMMMQVGPDYSVVSSWTVHSLAKHLTEIPILRGVEIDALRRLLPAGGLRQLLPGEYLLEEGKYNEFLFIILSGEAEVSLRTSDEARTRLIKLQAGAFAGELSLLANAPASATVSAISDLIVVQIPKYTVYRLMAEAPPFQQALSEIYTQISIKNFIAETVLFKDVSEETVEALVEAAQVRVAPAGEIILREGTLAKRLYHVRAGFVRITHSVGDRERVLVYSRRGDEIGGYSLLLDLDSSYTATTETRTELVELSPEVFDTLRIKQPVDYYKILRAAGKAALEVSQGEFREEGGTQALDKLGEQGIIQGHEILVINSSICVDCNNCVDACARRHGHTRLERRGMTLGNLLFPTACQHCENPLCLMCSVNGIQREPDGQIRITDNCIGCGACAERCPYDNILMADLSPENQKNSQDDNWLVRLFPMFQRGEVPTPADITDSGQRVAVKCDLCAGYSDGPACVRACPVGAALRIDPTDFFADPQTLIGLEMQRMRKDEKRLA